MQQVVDGTFIISDEFYRYMSKLDKWSDIGDGDFDLYIAGEMKNNRLTQ